MSARRSGSGSKERPRSLARKPDTRALRFAAEARRQSLLASRQPTEAEALDFIEGVGDFTPNA